MKSLESIKKLKRSLHIASLPGFLGFFAAFLLLPAGDIHSPESINAHYAFEKWVFFYLLLFWTPILILDLSREAFTKWGSPLPGTFRSTIMMFDRLLMASLWLVAAILPMVYPRFGDTMTFWLFFIILVLSLKDPKALHFDSDGIIAFSTWGENLPWEKVEKIESEKNNTVFHFLLREGKPLKHKIRAEEAKQVSALLTDICKAKGIEAKFKKS